MGLRSLESSFKSIVASLCITPNLVCIVKHYGCEWFCPREKCIFFLRHPGSNNYSVHSKKFRDIIRVSRRYHSKKNDGLSSFLSQRGETVERTLEQERRICYVLRTLWRTTNPKAQFRTHIHIPQTWTED